MIEPIILGYNALEATNEINERLTIADDPMDGPMKVQIITDKMIERANLKPVTNPIPFVSGVEPTEDGIYSYYIFGTSPDERKRQLAYIDLKEKFFHPYVYEVLKTLDKRIELIAAGKNYWYIDEYGKIEQIVDENDKRFNEDNTGLKWLIKNFHKIKFKETDSLGRKEKLRLLENLSDEELFISKWVVIPVFYRDVATTNGRPSLPDIAKDYNRLISFSNGIGTNPFDFMNNQLLFNMQLILVSMRKFGQDLIRGKHGAFHRTILGKTTDRGSRDVISVPVMTNQERPEDNPIDIFHTGFPLAKCIVMGYDFIMKYCLDFFENSFKERRDYNTYIRTEDGSYQFDKSIKIKDQLLIFNKSYIDKRMKLYINTPTSRFDKIEVVAEDGTKIPMILTGSFTNIDPASPQSSTLINRPMTWTDLFYIAAMTTVSDKYVYTTRYPITSYNSIFASKCLPLSTLKTTPAYVGGVFYRNYPVVDLNAPPEKLNVMFIDTVTLSNMFLDIIGGDLTQIIIEVAYKSNLVQEKLGELLTRGVYNLYYRLTVEVR